MSSKLRETLENIRQDLWDLMGSSSESLRESLACKIRATIRAALSAPPRNCDIGTVEEQYDRHDRYCMLQDCQKCHTEDAAYECTKCYAKWAQMPYESEVK